jgi:hypothetical protein
LSRIPSSKSLQNLESNDSLTKAKQNTHTLDSRHEREREREVLAASAKLIKKRERENLVCMCIQIKGEAVDQNAGERGGEREEVMTKEAKVVIGKYQIGRTLGEGGFGVVKLTRHVETGELFAIKILERHSVIARKFHHQVLSLSPFLFLLSYWCVRSFVNFVCDFNF